MDIVLGWSDMEKYYEKLVASGGKLNLNSTEAPPVEEYKDPVDKFKEKYKNIKR